MPVTLTPSHPVPPIWLASGDYRVFLSARGTGFSSYGNYLLNAWTPDSVQDGGGWYLYLRDLDNQRFWSAFPITRKRPSPRRRLRVNSSI
jgi:cellobiose phosphorylase